MCPKINPCKTPKNIFRKWLKIDPTLGTDYMEIFILC